ncbi:MAG: hypothetical protein NUW01_05180, partial [Gemmatimonadaceae bacterium]|nr:hypothetical protein [Gemmatimonadaceae bacterium]
MDTRACTDDSRFLHEPRVLWTVQEIQASASAATALASRVEVDKDHFRNGGRYPITLTHCLLSGIGYTFREFADSGAAALSNRHNCMAAAANMVDVFISAPYTLHLARRDIRVSSLPAQPVAEPSMRYYLASGYSSGLWGVSRWDFERLLWLPRKATIQFDLGGWALPNIGTFLASNVPTSVAFDEVHTGMFGGNNRLRERADLEASPTALVTNEENLVVDAF